MEKPRDERIESRSEALDLPGRRGDHRRPCRPVGLGPAAFGRQPIHAAPPAKNDQVGDGPRLQEVRVPTNTNDPIALVNGEIITRQRLAGRGASPARGAEILETLIARVLIDQAMRAQKIEVTAAEIDQEIDNVAWKTAQVTREVWLRNLDKERVDQPG